MNTPETEEDRATAGPDDVQEAMVKQGKKLIKENIEHARSWSLRTRKKGKAFGLNYFNKKIIRRYKNDERKSE